ncbi:hypothetical protein R5M08_004009, partial [Providencia rettgeri]|nr:hypothetical protein [Providencia rettgeri]ELS4585813.1 hypothetical protein [Providencia rettgeri]
TTQQLRTTKEMDKQLDGKLDKTSVISVINGGTGATNPIDAQKNLGIRKMTNYTNNSENGLFVPQEAYDFRKIASYDLVSQYPLGISGGLNDEKNAWIASGNGYVCQLAVRGFTDNSAPNLSAVMAWTKEGIKYRINGVGTSNREAFGSVYSVYSTQNTTKDSNGNLKAASPIIRVFADHIVNNDESEGVTLKKLHTGIYQLHGTLGLHSDASWGGINGGITIPCGINQLPLVYALYDVLEKGKPHPFDGRIVEPDEDGDIVLYTSYRKHDLPQNIQYERFKLYPEFLRDATAGEESIPGFDGKVELTPGEPCDIPVGHWVDVRVNMPSNSIYNQKQAEAERLAKIEAERLAQEEAKRAAEEAERVD